MMKGLTVLDRAKLIAEKIGGSLVVEKDEHGREVGVSVERNGSFIMGWALVSTYPEEWVESRALNAPNIDFDRGESGLVVMTRSIDRIR